MGLAKFHPSVYPHFLIFDLPTAAYNFHQTSTKPDDKDIEASHQLNNPCPYEVKDTSKINESSSSPETEGTS